MRILRKWILSRFQNKSLIAIAAVIFSMCGTKLFSQQQNIPLSKQFFLSQEVVINQSEEIVHTSFHPIVQSKLNKITLNNHYSADTNFFLPTFHKNKRRNKSTLARKLFYEHLFIVDTNDFYLTLDPIFNFEVGKDMNGAEEQMLYKNMRGFMLRADIGKKLSFQSTFRENQARFPEYVSSKTSYTQVAVGQGRVKVLDENEFDFAMASAYVSYSPLEMVNLQIGHGKHFIGNGYRSHFLSDQAFNYPFLRIITEWFDGKLQYTNLYSSFQDLNRLNFSDREGLFERKMGNFIYLDYAVNKNLYVGLFEGRIWPTMDSAGHVVKPLLAYNPIILTNSIVYGDDDSNSSGMIGLNFRWDFIKSAQLYGQFAMASGKSDQSSLQIGGKLYPFKNLFLQAEYNMHLNDDSVSISSNSAMFTHYNEQLNYTLGNYDEVFLRGNYMYKRFIFDAKLNFFQKRDMNQIFMDICTGVIVNRSTNFSINVGANYRAFDNENLNSAQFFYVALRTNLQNVYYDF